MWQRCAERDFSGVGHSGGQVLSSPAANSSACRSSLLRFTHCQDCEVEARLSGIVSRWWPMHVGGQPTLPSGRTGQRRCRWRFWKMTSRMSALEPPGYDLEVEAAEERGLGRSTHRFNRHDVWRDSALEIPETLSICSPGARVRTVLVCLTPRPSIVRAERPRARRADVRVGAYGKEIERPPLRGEKPMRCSRLPANRRLSELVALSLDVSLTSAAPA